jgi:hypothetical protein
MARRGSPLFLGSVHDRARRHDAASGGGDCDPRAVFEKLHPRRDATSTPQDGAASDTMRLLESRFTQWNLSEHCSGLGATGRGLEDR